MFLQKMSKFQPKKKIVLPCFGDLVAGWSSRMSQSRVHTEIFRRSLAGQCPSCEKYLEYFSKFGFLMFSRDSVWRLVRRWKVQQREGSKIFAAYLVSRTSSHEKHSEKFFKIFVLSVLVTGLSNFSRLDSVAKITCFAHISQFLNVFSFCLEHF